MVSPVNIGIRSLEVVFTPGMPSRNFGGCALVVEENVSASL